MVSIAGLGVPEKAEVKFVVEGEDANEVAIALANAFAAKFGEEG